VEKLIRIVVTYIAFCLVGAGLEWCYGAFWDVVGTAPWMYPNSPWRYTCLEGVPLWGFGGFVAIAVYRAVRDRSARRLLGAVVPLVLAALWILFCTLVLSP
jgi:hypothetical protein